MSEMINENVVAEVATTQTAKQPNKFSRFMQKYGTPIVIGIFCFVLVVYVLSLFLPLVWGLYSSLKTPREFTYELFDLPKKWQWTNYSLVFKYFKVKVTDGFAVYNVEISGIPYLFTWLIVTVQGIFTGSFPSFDSTRAFGLIENSLMYALLGGFVAAFVPCVMGYLIARFKYKISRIISSFSLVAMSIPIIGSEASMLQILKGLNIYDTMFSAYVMAANFLTLYLFVYSAIFVSLSDSYAEAAKIDGAGEFRIFFGIYLPLAKNTLFTIWLLMFINRWNDYATPLLYLPAHPTLAVGIYKFDASTVTAIAYPPMKIASCMILIVPILILFAFLHKRIMGNLSMGGVKE